MTYTSRLEHAMRVAAHYHDGQYRKDKIRMPYVSHVFAVATLVSNFTNDEDIIIAAMLHDTIEDTAMKAEELKELFGERVLSLVENVSEPKGSRSWKERKDIYIEKLREGSDDALLIAVADKLHNMQYKHRQIQEYGKQYMETSGLLHEKYVWYHGEVLEIAKRLPHKELIAAYEETFQKEKELLES